MREIPLTRSLVALVDDEDYESLSAYKWHARKDGYRFYAARSHGGSTILMHRVLLGAPAGMAADHLSGDGLDNRRANLRLATHAQNIHNRGANKNNTSGYKGVSLNRGRWAAHINVNGKRKHLGSFSYPQEAHAAYCSAAEKLHGEFARFA